MLEKKKLTNVREQTKQGKKMKKQKRRQVKQTRKILVMHICRTRTAWVSGAVVMVLPYPCIVSTQLCCFTTALYWGEGGNGLSVVWGKCWLEYLHAGYFTSRLLCLVLIGLWVGCEAVCGYHGGLFTGVVCFRWSALAFYLFVLDCSNVYFQFIRFGLWFYWGWFFLACFVSLQSLLYSGLSMIVLWFVCCKLTVSLVWAIAHSSTGTSIVMLVSGST